MDPLTALNKFRQYFESYVPLTDAEWQALSQYLTVDPLKKKKFYVEAGKVCDQIGLVVRGSVRYYHIKDGEEITGYFSFENEMLSSYKSFLTRTPAANYIQALEDTITVNLSHKNLQQAL